MRARPAARRRGEALEVGLGLLLAALVLGLLRFARLGEWSLWFDEVLTWGDSHDFPGGLVNRAGYWLVRQTVEWTGGEPTEFTLRLGPRWPAIWPRWSTGPSGPSPDPRGPAWRPCSWR